MTSDVERFLRDVAEQEGISSHGTVANRHEFKHAIERMREASQTGDYGAAAEAAADIARLAAQAWQRYTQRAGEEWSA
jgi:hypothetical protein